MEIPVVSANREGLGSRLKSLLSVMRLNDKYKIYWERNKKASCEWRDLFENRIATKKRPAKNSKHWYCSWKFDATQEEIKKYKRRRFDYMYGNTPDFLLDGITAQIKKLIPVEYIRNEVEAFKSQFDNNTISACVRTWADVKNTPLARKFSIKEVFNHVDKHIIDKVFLTSDVENTYTEFVNRYGKNNVLYYPKRTGWGDNRSKKGMQDTLIEMLLPGNNRKMLLSWHSAFTECQWWFGGAKAKTTEMVRWK